MLILVYTLFFHSSILWFRGAVLTVELKDLFFRYIHVAKSRKFSIIFVKTETHFRKHILPVAQVGLRKSGAATPF